MQTYERPEIKLVGTLLDVTLQTHVGDKCDKRSCTLGKHQSLHGTSQAS
jgi:hypothetical protein